LLFLPILPSNRKQGKLSVTMTIRKKKKSIGFNWTEQKEEQLTASWKRHECLYDVSSALKNAAVAQSCSSVDFIVIEDFHQVHDG